ncbi:hypothetical protein OIU85_014249, partial [Salix viminalis]
MGTILSSSWPINTAIEFSKIRAHMRFPQNHNRKAVNRLMSARCDHEQMKNAEGCIVEIIGEKNLDHFFVGTQDTDMRKKFQE